MSNKDDNDNCMYLHELPYLDGDYMGRVNLLDMPLEIRYNIYSHLLDHNEVADISLKPKRKPHHVVRLKSFFPRAVGVFNGLLASSHAMNKEVQAFLGRNCTFFSTNSKNILATPHHFGFENCNLVAKFVFRMEFHMKVEDEDRWPKILDMFSRIFPNLEVFELYSDWAVRKGPYPQDESRDPEGSVTRLQQEMRAKFRFLAFFVVRHPNFRGKSRVIRPAKNGPRYTSGEATVRHAYIAEVTDQKVKRRWDKLTRFTRYRTPGELTAPSAEFHDEVMNTTMARRYAWTELAEKLENEIDFFIMPPQGQTKDDVLSSEVGEGRNFFREVDQQGYRPERWFTRRGISTASVDVLIELGKKRMKEEKERVATVAVVRPARNTLRGRGVQRGGRANPGSVAGRGRGGTKTPVGSIGTTDSGVCTQNASLSPATAGQAINTVTTLQPINGRTLHTPRPGRGRGAVFRSERAAASDTTTSNLTPRFSSNDFPPLGSASASTDLVNAINNLTSTIPQTNARDNQRYRGCGRGSASGQGRGTRNLQNTTQMNTISTYADDSGLPTNTMTQLRAQAGASSRGHRGRGAFHSGFRGRGCGAARDRGQCGNFHNSTFQTPPHNNLLTRDTSTPNTPMNAETDNSTTVDRPSIFGNRSVSSANEGDTETDDMYN